MLMLRQGLTLTLNSFVLSGTQEILLTHFQETAESNSPQFPSPIKSPNAFYTKYFVGLDETITWNSFVAVSEFTSHNVPWVVFRLAGISNNQL